MAEIIQAIIQNGKLVLPGIEQFTMPLVDRSQIKIPDLSEALLARVEETASIFANLVPDSKKFIRVESLAHFKELLEATDARIEELKDPEFLGALIYRLHYKKDSGCLRGVMTTIAVDCGKGSLFAQKLKSVIVRMAIHEDHGRELTVRDLEQSEKFTSFVDRHYFHNLLVSSSPAEIIEAAFPESMSGVDAILRSEYFRSGWAAGLQVSRRDRLIDTVARTLIECGAIERSKDRFTLHPEKFRETNWSSVFKAKMIGTEITEREEFRGDIFAVLAAGAARFGYSELFGIKPGQIPPWYITTDGLWKKKFGGVAIIKLFGKYVVNRVEGVVAYREYYGQRVGKLSAQRISKLNWGTLFNKEHSGATKGAGVSPIELLKMVDPDLFGVRNDQRLPYEFKSYAGKGVREVRACLAIQLLRSGLGSTLKSGKETYLKITLGDLDNWNVPSDFGVKWVKPYRGNLRALGNETVDGGINLTFSPTKPSDPKKKFKEKIKLILQEKKEVLILLPEI